MRVDALSMSAFTELSLSDLLRQTFDEERGLSRPDDASTAEAAKRHQTIRSSDSKRSFLSQPRGTQGRTYRPCLAVPCDH